MISRAFNLQRIINAALAVLLLSVAACGSAPPRQPAAIEQASKADMAAHRALRDGDLMRAREMFRQTMLMQRSLDNYPASAMAAINLSSVTHKLGDDGAALLLLDDILADSTTLIPSELRAAAAFRKGIILVDMGKVPEAESALQLANNECNNRCAYAAGINNLRARFTLQKGEFATALEMAKSGMGGGADKEERANAQRVAGAAELALGLHESALAHYQAALEQDKKLALSSRIAEDLKGMAKALENLGRKAEADIFARRAEAVIEAAQKIPGKAAK